jgi:hypothetical protein
MNEMEIKRWLKDIEAMSHEDMARLWRFSKPGHPLFDRNLPLFEIFEKRFASLGGWTPALSKKIGWA